MSNGLFGSSWSRVGHYSDRIVDTDPYGVSICDWLCLDNMMGHLLGTQLIAAALAGARIADGFLWFHIFFGWSFFGTALSLAIDALS